MNRFIERLTVAGCIGWGLVFGFVIWFVIYSTAQAQNRGHNQVQCRYVPNGDNITFACDNGYWWTQTPEGEIFTGNGRTDPNDTMRGSTIPLDSSGTIRIDRGQVTPPTQTYPVLEPGQANAYGLPHRQN